MKQNQIDVRAEDRPAGPYDVLVLAASAGGHNAITRILRDLPADFSVPVIVMMHLGVESIGTPDVLGRHLPFAVEWVKPDSVLTPRKVLICPPKAFVELLPDGTFRLSPSEGHTLVDKPMDRLLESVARSFGERSIGVILTGMGSDGALGARQLHLAGGKVLVQSKETSEFPAMPEAAIQAGAADLVVPLQDIGQVINELAAGTPRPLPRSEIEAIRGTFGDQGQIATLAREIDWSRRAIGPVREWSPVLRSVLRLAMDYPTPYSVLWGPELIQFYNDAAIATHGTNHPQVFGQPAFEGHPELQEPLESLWRRVLAGETVHRSAMLVPTMQAGKLTDAWFEFVYSPIREADGSIGGVANVWNNRTDEVLASRRLNTLNRLATLQVASNRREALGQALDVLQGNADVLFAVAYLLDASGKQALLAGATGVSEGESGIFAPHQLPISSVTESWPLNEVLENGKVVIVDDVALRFGAHGNGRDRVTPDAALIYPLRDGAEGRVIGMLVLGTNPRLPLNDLYRNFLVLAGETISSKVAEAHAHQREDERMERLAELDRTKTEFFANISHEFRTPLTLLLAPLEDLVQRREELPASLLVEVEVAAKNARRLLRLVNSLLDFSQIEARREPPRLEPVDLCTLTTDIASAFRSTIEAAGLRLRVECDPKLRPVPLDRDMWEKIVSNLLSNALKFTFEGEIALQLRALSFHAELVVSDTGIGIPEQELPNLFKRFHRVPGARARTAEGSGIGLSMVDDLVKRLGGQIRVRSREGQGTEFTIWLPYKSVRKSSELPSPAVSGEGREVADQLAREAMHWLDGAQTARGAPAEMMEDPQGPPPSNEQARQGRILVADDNADIRNYLQRLLSPRWEVELAADGESALDAALRLRADVILTDVMMPGMDGFELLQRVREHEALKQTPVVLLTAHAGEEAAIQGLLAGADDYIAKPFSPGELVARIQTVFERARAHAVLRQSEERQAFLLRFSDFLRAQPDEQSIKEHTVRMLAEHLRLDRCYISEVFEQQGFSTVGPEQIRPDLPPMTGVYQLSDYPETMRQLATQPMVIDDAANDPRFSDSEKTLLAGLHLRALLVTALRKGPREVIWALAAAMATPRNWTEDERVLLEEVAERAWAAIERARAERALRFQALLLDTVEQSVIASDLEGKIIYWNQYAEELFGWKAEEVLGRNIIGVTTPDKNENAEEIMSALLKGKSWSGEFTLQRRDGATFPAYVSDTPIYDSEGNITGIVGVAVDITERKRAEEALRESEFRIQRALSIQTVGVLFFRLDGCMTDANQAFLRMSGYRREELLAIRDWAVLTPPEFMQVTSEAARELAETGETAPYEKQMIRKDGSRWWGLFAPTRLAGEGLQSECMEFIIDISEQKHNEEALRVSEKRLQLLNEELEQKVLEKTAEVHTLASEVIKSTQRERRRISQILHDDLQQRIYAIQMQLSFLLEGLQNENQVARREAAGMGKELADVLKITRNLSIDLSPPILAGEGLLQAIDWLASRMRHHYSLDVEIQADGSFVLPDEELHVFLFNCVRELLFNVVKHAETRQAVVALQWVESGLQIEVRDGGKGFQMRTPGDGEDVRSRASLGLAAMQHQLRLFGGSMKIHSEPGAGTRVVLFVPTGNIKPGEQKTA